LQRSDGGFQSLGNSANQIRNITGNRHGVVADQKLIANCVSRRNCNEYITSLRNKRSVDTDIWG